MSVLGKKFGFWSLLRFSVPSVLMMLVTSLYTIIDSIFVSRFVGTNALSAINIAYPFINVVIAIGVMLSSGGSAIIAREIGEGKHETANKHFTLIVIFGAILGFAVAIIGVVFVRPISAALGATPVLLEYCVEYLAIQMAFAPFCVLQLILQSFFVTAGKPALGMILSVSAGIVNGVLDFFFIVILDMGIAGAALGTGIGYVIPCVAGIFFFSKKTFSLHFQKTKMQFKILLDSCLNGSSEMVSNLASGVTTLLFNLMMLKFAGEDGVAAITIVLYAQFLLSAVILGYSIGVSPVVSYNYGAQNHARLKKICRINLIFTVGVSLLVFIVAQIFSPYIVLVFTPKASNVYALAVVGMHLFSFSFLFSGLNIMASGLFTALSNGKISAIISFLRTFLFTAALTLLLPMAFEINGVWLSTVMAEILALAVSFIYVVKYKNKYHYC